MDIRICQFFRLTARNGNIYRFQNYFANQQRTNAAELHDFAPFRVEGSVTSLNGENSIVQVLFPNIEYALQLLRDADGNRLSQLRLTTQWLALNASGVEVNSPNVYTEFFTGVGSSISETTLELRFRSAVDSVVSNFPARVLTQQNVGILPLDSQVGMR